MLVAGGIPAVLLVTIAMALKMPAASSIGLLLVAFLLVGVTRLRTKRVLFGLAVVVYLVAASRLLRQRTSSTRERRPSRPDGRRPRPRRSRTLLGPVMVSRAGHTLLEVGSSVETPSRSATTPVQDVNMAIRPYPCSYAGTSFDPPCLCHLSAACPGLRGGRTDEWPACGSAFRCDTLALIRLSEASNLTGCQPAGPSGRTQALLRTRPGSTADQPDRRA